MKEHRDTALFWHSIYISMGRPNRGTVRDIMVKSRNVYHHAIRKVKKHAAHIRATKLLEAAQEGDIKLLKEMKKIKTGPRDTVDLPEVVDNVEGEEEIVKKFRQVYSDLYNSADSSEAMLELKQKLSSLIGPD